MKLSTLSKEVLKTPIQKLGKLFSQRMQEVDEYRVQSHKERHTQQDQISSETDDQ